MASNGSVISIPNPPVGQLVAFVRVHRAEVFEQVVEGMSGQVQSSAGLMRVEKVDYIQAKVSLEPLDVGVGAVKHLRTGKNLTAFSGQGTNLYISIYFTAKIQKV